MTDETQEGTVIAEVTFRYTKSVLCRVIHADGVWGGNTPQGYIQMGFYSEKHEVPESQTYDVIGKDPSSKGGTLKEKQLASRGMGREIEAEIIISPQVARSLKAWLEGRLAILDAAQAE